MSIDMKELFNCMDVIGFLLAGFSTFAILATVALTRSVKRGGCFQNEEDVAFFGSEIRASSKKGMKWTWFFIENSIWFLAVGFIGFLLQVPAKIFA